MSNIPLHPEHGLNPTIPICFWCGEEKNEIAFLGNKCKKEAPKHTMLDYEPCNKCQEKWNQGVALLEVQNDPITKDQPPLTPKTDHYPTGRFLVLDKKAINDHQGEKDPNIRLTTSETFEELLTHFKN